MPVNAVNILYLSQIDITSSSLTESPGSAIYTTPLLWALSMLSSNGKNASLASDTPVIEARYSFFSSDVKGSGLYQNNTP